MFTLPIVIARFISSLFKHRQQTQSYEESDIEELPDSIKADFKSASAHVRNVSGQLADEDLLYLYARYKRVVAGVNETPKPSELR